MKSHFNFFLFLICLVKTSFGQSDFRILKANPATIPIILEKSEIRGTHYFTFPESEIVEIINHPNQKIRLEFPWSGKQTHQIELKPDLTFSQKLVVKTSGGKIEKPISNQARHFKGSVVGHKSGLAAFSFSETDLMGIFSFGSGNFNFVKTQYLENGRPVFALFNDQNIAKKQPFTCMADHLEGKVKMDHKTGNEKIDKGASGIEACKKVSVYLECDHKMFLDNGSSVTNTANWATSMLNIVSALYANEGIRLTTSEVFVHTQPDNYPETSSFAALAAFGDSLSSRPPFSGDLAHLLSTKNNSLGGVAYLDVLCDGFGNNCAYSNIYNAFAPLPVYSWTVNVVAHEIGHNFGSPHTQSCSWPIGGGNFGMLDSCYAAEEGCYTGPVIPIMGTIMSYCHLVMGVDLSKGFGVLPGALIRSKFLEATCLNGNVVLPILTVSAPDTVCAGSSAQLSVTEVAGAEYEWTGPNGYSSFQRQPVLSPVSSIHNGLFSVVVKKDGCESYPFNTNLKVDCLPILGDGDQTLCPSQIIPVQYFAQFTPNSGNEFVAELSNSSGSFSNPVEIGRHTSQLKNGSFLIQIPENAIPGNSYFIRVRSGQPAQLGEAIGPYTISVAGLAAPVADASRCGPGSVSFSGNGNSIYSWFSDSLSSVPLATGQTFSTPVLTQSTTFWVEAQPATKAQVGPTNPLFSGSAGPLSNFTQGLFFKVFKDLTIDSVSIVATGFGDVSFRIRDSANTKTIAFVQRPVSGNQSLEKIFIGIRLNPGTYRVDAVGSSVASLTRSSNVVSFPFSSAGLLSITHPTAESRYYWFYNWKITGLDCSSPRKKIFAILNPIPNSPFVFSDSVCRQGVLNLQADGAAAGQSYQWFSASGNAIPGANQAQFSTPILNQSVVYSVSIKSAQNCESSRISVQAKVFPAPSPPPSDTVSACFGDTAVLEALGPVGSSNSFSWFQNSLIPIPGSDSSIIQVPALVPDSLFFVCSVSEKGCPSDTVSILLKTNPRPDQPIVEVKPQCGPGSVTLLAHGVLGATSFEWFTQATGGEPIPNSSDSVFVSPMINATPITYYVTPVNAFGCRLQVRVVAVASITLRPDNATGSDSSRCGSGSMILRAYGSQFGEHFHWYNSINSQFSDTLIGGATGSLNLSNQTQTGDFYVSLVRDEFCESESRLHIRAVIFEQPLPPLLALEGGYLVCSVDTIFDWYKDGAFLQTTGDSLNPAQFGNGLYKAVLRKSTGCFSESNSILISGKSSLKKLSGITVFPNPAKDRIWVRMDEGKISKAVLFDLQLRKLQEQLPESDDFQLSVTNLPKGMYILVVESQGGVTQHLPFLKE